MIDDNDNALHADSRDGWRDWLRWSNLLNFRSVPACHHPSARGIGDTGAVPSAVGEVTEPVGLTGAWLEVYQQADADGRQLIAQLADTDVPDTRGRRGGRRHPGGVSWPTRKVLIDIGLDDEERQHLAACGWLRVLTGRRHRDSRPAERRHMMPQIILGPGLKRLTAACRRPPTASCTNSPRTTPAPGLHIEPINNSADPRARTGRVDISYRAVLFKLQGSQDDASYVFAGTYPHDEAIDDRAEIEDQHQPPQRCRRTRSRSTTRAPAPRQ